MAKKGSPEKVFLALAKAAKEMGWPCASATEDDKPQLQGATVEQLTKAIDKSSRQVKNIGKKVTLKANDVTYFEKKLEEAKEGFSADKHTNKELTKGF